MRFFDTILTKLLRFARINLFSEISDFFYHFVLNLMEKVKAVDLSDIVRILWCPFEVLHS